MSFLFVLFVIVLMFLVSSIKILNQYERAVVFFLGKIYGAQGPGIVFIWPVIFKMFRVDMRTVTLDVPPQDAISRDNVTIKVNAVVYFRVIDPVRAIIEVENYLLATSKLAQTTLRSVLGQVELDELLASRESINHRLQTILDAQTEPWGVKVSNVEVKQIDLPVEMQKAMASQAQAERDRRAKVIAAEGELQASQKLAEAAQVMSNNPYTIQLRFLQTVAQISGDRNTTTILPIPVEFLKSVFLGKQQDQGK